jgi:flagellar motor protein MotB
MLTKIAQILQADTTRIEVVGHTDLQGTAQSNFTLSEQRAKNVADMLRHAAPLGKRVSYSGRGESEPIDPQADTHTAENRARNRRIEIIVYPFR